MPVMAYLAMDDARALTRADFVRLGLVTGPGKSDVLPYSARYMRDFEERYCYDHSGTRTAAAVPARASCRAAMASPW